jgi:hypothetical protein
MQVIILEYVVPRVLEYPCVKFDRVSTSKCRIILHALPYSIVILHLVF